MNVSFTKWNYRLNIEHAVNLQPDTNGRFRHSICVWNNKNFVHFAKLKVNSKKRDKCVNTVKCTVNNVAFLDFDNATVLKSFQMFGKRELFLAN